MNCAPTAVMEESLMTDLQHEHTGLTVLADSDQTEHDDSHETAHHDSHVTSYRAAHHSSQLDTHKELSSDSNSDLAESTYLSKLRNSMNLITLMRLGGALAVITAMGLYLIDGLAIDGDLERLMVSVAFTATLNIAGLLMIHALKEPRGARVFFALSLVSVPMIVTVMGALSYSVFHWDELSSRYPEFATWTVADGGEMWLSVLGTAAILLPVTWFALSVLARRSRGTMTLLLLGSSSLLLVPLRGPLPIALLATIAVVATVAILRRRQAIDVSLSTLEGRIASAVMFLPPVIMFVRALLIHGHDQMFVLILVLASQAGLRLIVPQQTSGGWISTTIAVTYAAMATFSALLTFDIVEHYLPWALSALLFNGMIAALFLDIGRRIDVGWLRGALGTLAALQISVLSLTAIFESGFSMLAVALVSLSALLAYGIRFQVRLVAIIAALAMAALLTSCAPEMIDWTVSAGWIGIAAAGILCIAAASVIERYGSVMYSAMRDSNKLQVELNTQ